MYRGERNRVPEIGKREKVLIEEDHGCTQEDPKGHVHVRHDRVWLLGGLGGLD